MATDRSSLQALKNLIAEADLILEPPHRSLRTAPPPLVRIYAPPWHSLTIYSDPTR
jgi:hypothetical protein